MKPAKNAYPPEVFDAVRELIENSRQQASMQVNAIMTQLYWQIGVFLSTQVLQGQRAEYGAKVIGKLSEELTTHFGRGWSQQQLRPCLRIAETFPHKDIFYAVSRELSWTHLRTIMYLETEPKIQFYIEMCKLEGWSSRVLQERIQSMLYERTIISKLPDETIKNELNELNKTETLSKNLVFRDPYLLDFLGLHDSYSEKDLESAILVELQKFIIELGSDFAFMDRQKRITIDQDDYYIDLLFFHRRLKCLIAIDLKLGKFQAQDKGQMELYLKYLEKYEKIEGENSPIGLILCASKNSEHIELLQLEDSNIKVAEYIIHLPDIKTLENRLQQAIAAAKIKYNER